MGGAFPGAKSGGSLAVRGFVSVLLFLGYYLLALTVAGVLFFIPYAEIRYTGRLHYIWLPLFCIAAGIIVLWSILPRIDRFHPPGPRLFAETEPRLFEEIGEVARRSGQETPREVYLVPGVTAWVAQRGGLMGIGGRRIMVLGLALLRALDINEFRAVLAHEFGHFCRGDTRLGSWVYRTRANIERTLQRLRKQGKVLHGYESIVQAPFVFYGNLFLRITQAISRHQEYVADGLAAASSGSDVLASGLRKIGMAGLAYEPFWANELLPVLNAGFLPPYAAGFGSFLESELVKKRLTEAIDREIQSGSSSPYDSHPSLKERIGALSAFPGARPPEGPQEPAASLLGRESDLERELFRFLNPAAGEKLKPISWDKVIEAVYVPYWQSLTQKHRADLAGMTLQDLPARRTDFAALARRMAEVAKLAATDDQAKAYAIYVIYAATASKLVKLGWQATAGFVRYVTLSCGNLSWEPLPQIEAVFMGVLPGDDWRALCAKLGIAGVGLSDDGSPAPEAQPKGAT